MSVDWNKCYDFLMENEGGDIRDIEDQSVVKVLMSDIEDIVMPNNDPNDEGYDWVDEVNCIIEDIIEECPTTTVAEVVY